MSLKIVLFVCLFVVALAAEQKVEPKEDMKTADTFHLGFYGPSFSYRTYPGFGLRSSLNFGWPYYSSWGYSGLGLDLFK